MSQVHERELAPKKTPKGAGETFSSRSAVSDETLMERYVAGDEASFELLYGRYAPRLLAALHRGLGRGPAATELVQQTFLQVHRARRDFDLERPFRPWIFTICFNLRREHFRRKSRRPEVLLEPEHMPETEQPPLDLERAERAQHVRVALEVLPDSQREVIELHWFQEMPFKEVAVVVGASVTAVKVRAHRGYGRLRTALLAASEDAPHTPAMDRKPEPGATGVKFGAGDPDRNLSSSTGILPADEA